MNAQNIDMRQETNPKHNNPYTGTGWVLHAFIYGVFMFIIMSLLYPWVDGSGIDVGELFKQFLVWMAAGVFYGLGMKYFINWLNRRAKKAD